MNLGPQSGAEKWCKRWQCSRAHHQQIPSADTGTRPFHFPWPPGNKILTLQIAKGLKKPSSLSGLYSVWLNPQREKAWTHNPLHPNHPPLLFAQPGRGGWVNSDTAVLLVASGYRKAAPETQRSGKPDRYFQSTEVLNQYQGHWIIKLSPPPPRI